LVPILIGVSGSRLQPVPARMASMSRVIFSSNIKGIMGLFRTFFIMTSSLRVFSPVL
jgi:hypothetical protein